MENSHRGSKEGQRRRQRKTNEDKRLRQKSVERESGVTNPSEDHRRNVVAFNGRNRDMRGCWLIGCPETAAEKGVAAVSRIFPGNAMERQSGKNQGNGLQPSPQNHHEMMVATERRNPVNIIFYLSKVISPMFLGGVRTPRSPRIRQIHTRPL